MKKNRLVRLIKLLSLVASVTFALLIFVTCADKPKSLSFKQGEIEIVVGFTATLEVEKNYKDTLVFSSSNPLVATVDDSGKVKAEKVGECIITVVCGALSDTCKVVVISPDEGAGEEALTLTLSQDEADILFGLTLPVSLTLSLGSTPVTPTSVQWTSNKTNVVTVQENGSNAVLTGVSVGNALITVVAEYNGKVTYANIDVNVKIDASINVDTAAISLVLHPLNTGEITEKTITVTSATINSIAWSGEYEFAVADETNADCIEIFKDNDNARIVAKKIGNFNLEVYFTDTASGGKVAAIIPVTIKKAKGALPETWRFEYIEDNVNDYVLAENITDLSVNGGFVGFSVDGERVVALNNAIGFSHNAISPYINLIDGSISKLNLETTTCIYSIKCTVTDRTGWIAISNYTGLNNIRNDMTADYYLTGDIDCSGERFASLVDSGEFTGVFDGNGHKIKDLCIKHPAVGETGWVNSRTMYEGKGCFATIGIGGVFKNVVFESYHTFNDTNAPNWSAEAIIYRAAVFAEIKGTVENVIVQVKGGLFVDFDGFAAATYGSAVVRNCVLDTTEMRLQVPEDNIKYTMSSLKAVLAGWNDNNAKVSNCYGNINSDNTLWRQTGTEVALCGNQTSANTMNCGFVTEYTKEQMIEYLTGKISEYALELYLTLQK